MRIRMALFLFFLLHSTSFLFAYQQPSDEVKTEGDTLFVGNKYSAALVRYREAFMLEMKQTIPRNHFLGECLPDGFPVLKN